MRRGRNGSGGTGCSQRTRMSSTLMATLVLAEIGTDKACYRDMSSFPETKAEKYANRSKGKKFLQYNRRQLSRIYPKGQRLDSSNYDPLPMWICGSQLVALNFQTPGKSHAQGGKIPTPGGFATDPMAGGGLDELSISMGMFSCNVGLFHALLPRVGRFSWRFVRAEPSAQGHWRVPEPFFVPWP